MCTVCFFFNDTATTEIYTLSLHDALPILPARTCFESLQPHQPLNPMQTARQPFRQHVFPHPPGAVGSVARNEAGADLCAKLFIASAALTAWSCQPRSSATCCT